MAQIVRGLPIVERLIAILNWSVGGREEIERQKEPERCDGFYSKGCRRWSAFEVSHEHFCALLYFGKCSLFLFMTMAMAGNRLVDGIYAFLRHG